LIVDHVLLTRFNLPSKGPESLIRAQDGWLQRRVELFERYTIPSVAAQTVSNFSWIVYFDPESPRWLLDRLTPHVLARAFTPIFREEATWREVGPDARQVTGAAGSLLITTNLDNDDALARDFIERIQQLAKPGATGAIFLERGLIASGESTYLRRDRDNAFCSVAEPWTAEPSTAWRDWHIMLRSHMPVIAAAGPPGWLQIVHGQNVSNRVRGLRTDPVRYQNLFPGLIDHLPRPGTTALAADLLVAAPIRTLRDTVKGSAKRLLLAVGGKKGLDGVKLLLGPRKG
jgi:hypothetical protein